MKVRWTSQSIRLRITPLELDALGYGETVQAVLTLPGGLVWHVALVPAPDATRLTSEAGEVRFHLSATDQARLEQLDAEGVYFKDHSGLRYFVEKDFPCSHPRLVDALEAQPETFAPTPEFEARKNVPM